MDFCILLPDRQPERYENSSFKPLRDPVADGVE